MSYFFDIKKDPTYQRGILQGLEQGLERGLEQGLEQGFKEAIKDLLELKFGAEGFTLFTKVDKIENFEQLKKAKTFVKNSQNFEQVQTYFQKF